MLSILAIGRDERLLDTRVAVLRRTTAEVTQAKAEAASDLLKATRFDLIVLCHSLSLEESTEIAETAHRWHDGVHVLQVVMGFPRGESYLGIPVDAVVTNDPERLVEKVISLAKGKVPVSVKDRSVLNFKTASDAIN